MNAAPLLARIAAALGRAKLEGTLVGNAGAASLTLEFRETALNIRRLKVLAAKLDAVIFREVDRRSAPYELMTEDGLRLRFDPKPGALPVPATIRRRASAAAAKPSRAERLAALRKESDAALVDQIRRLLALPMAKRTNFLRVRIPGGGTAL